jgi:glutamate synthase (NADPH/NADH) small chain
VCVGGSALSSNGRHAAFSAATTGPGGATGNPKVFAGGDAANGGKEVVNAAAEGRDAAVAIHTMLMGGE